MFNNNKIANILLSSSLGLMLAACGGGEQPEEEDSIEGIMVSDGLEETEVDKTSDIKKTSLSEEELNTIKSTLSDPDNAIPAHFAFDSSDINPEDAPKLDRIAELLNEHQGLSITIAGHCDDRGTKTYNFALGQRRAESAKAYLVSVGVNADRINTISYGKERPLDKGENPTAWAANRRVEVKVY